MQPVNGVSNTLENLIFNHNTDIKWVKFGVLHEQLFIVYYTPRNEVVGGILVSPCPFVRPSVRL